MVPATPLHVLRALMAIMFNTARAAIRSKVLGSLLFVAVALNLASLLLGELSLHQEERITRDVSLFASTIFSVIITVYSSITLLHTEIEQRTLYTILSKPIRRWQFILGKWLGVMLLMLAIVAVFLANAVVLMLVQDIELTWSLWWSFYTLYLQICIVAAFSLLFASFASPLLSGFFTATVFVIGNLYSQIEGIRKLLGERGNVELVPLLDAMSLLLPNLESLNLSRELTYSVAVPGTYVLSATWYALSYSALVLMLAMLIFSRRDFM